MYLNPAIFILLILSVFGLSAVILFIIQSFNHLIRKIEKADEEKIHLHDSVNQKALQILEDAHKQNVQIVEEANRHAAKILSDAEISKTGMENEIKDKLGTLASLHKKTAESMNEQFEKNYKDAVTKLQSQDIHELEKITGEIEDDARAEMREFSNTLKEETVQVHQIVRERIEEEYAKAEQEIEKYKAERMQKIGDVMTPLLKNIVSLIIGRSLTPSDHESLITDAIRDASAQMPEMQHARQGNRPEGQ